MHVIEFCHGMFGTENGSIHNSFTNILNIILLHYDLWGKMINVIILKIRFNEIVVFFDLLDFFIEVDGI